MCSTQKICTKSRKLRTRQSEVRTAGFFLFSSILRAGKKVWVDEFDKKKLWISTKCPTFSDKVFFEIFSCTHFFPNFSEKPSWPFLVKIAFSGHFSFFTKSSLFFLEKIVIFFDFFSKKKFAKKHKKTWFCKKCVGRFQGRSQKVQKKIWEKSGFLLFQIPCKNVNLPKNAVFFSGDGKSVKRGFEGRKSCSKQENCWSRNFFSRLSPPSFLKETFFVNFVFFRVFVILQGISFLQKCEKMTKKWRRKISAGFCIFQISSV